MAVEEIAHRERVAEFKTDLRLLPLNYVIRKHITTGRPVALSDAAYYELRNEVAVHFHLHPSAVVMIGSGRTGFSLKPNKRYEPFSDESDIDLAIVAPERFDQFWDMVFEHWKANRLWTKSPIEKSFLFDLFRGWLWPRRLPPAPQFKQAVAWAEFEDRLSLVLFSGCRSVGARLYRTWDRLEAYQSIHVLECKRELGRGRSK